MVQSVMKIKPYKNFRPIGNGIRKIKKAKLNTNMSSVCENLSNKQKVQIKIQLNLNLPNNCLQNYKSNKPSEIIKNKLYLAGKDIFNNVCDDNINFFEQHNIKNVISIMSNADEFTLPHNFMIPSENHKRFNLNDKIGQNIKQFFKEANNFLHEKIIINNEAVFVHCQAGVSRSATIIASFLMQCGKALIQEEQNLESAIINIDSCLDFIRSKRNVINPNPDFINQLKARYENAHENTSEHDSNYGSDEECLSC